MGNPKGNLGEREAALLVQAWWRRLEPDSEFARVPMSGGWRGASDDARADLQLVGDLMTTAKRFPFCVEVKRREAWSFERWTAGRSSPVWGWWRECLQDAATAKKAPLLLVRQNRRPWYVVVGAIWYIHTDWCDRLNMESVLGWEPASDDRFGGTHPIAFELDEVVRRVPPAWVLPAPG